uniref:Warthog protein 6 n=1 Tax=Panagrolaimus superbus TaxID=310955 RepID=A0A914YLQ1_9BILA
MLRLLGLSYILFIINVYGQISQHKSCGSNSIPFDFRVDINGSPEIRCNTPPCFGIEQTSSSPSSFDDDGYAYGNRNIMMRRRRHKKSIHDRNADCTGRFTEQVCSSNNEWTAGIEEFNNGTHFILKAECCRYDGLNNATAIHTYSIRNGEHYTGGEVLDEGKLVAFDLIKEVRKNLGANNEAVYLVTVNRMICIPDPPEYRNRISPYFENDGLYDPEDFAMAGGYRGRTRGDDYLSPYGNNNRRYRPMYRSQVRRRPSYPRRRQYYRPLFDEYDYYDLEPMPLVRRPYRGRYRSRYEPEQYYTPKGRPRAYADGDGYSNPQPEPLEEYQEAATQAPYRDTEHKNPLPASYEQQPYAPQSQPETQPLPPPPQQSLQGYVQPQTFLQQPPPIQASYNPLPSYQPSPQATSCAVDPCGASNANAYSSQSNAYSGQQYSSGQSYSPPSGGADLNSVFSSLQCFSGDMTVQTPSGLKRMDELEVGDMILSIEQSMISFTPVVMFLHNEPKEIAVFKEIETADHRKLKLTDFHLIYVTSCKQEPLKLIHAKDVTIGQCVHIVDESQQSLKSAKVIAIREIEEVGIYAPLTASGDLMVNSVLASCHSNMGVQTLQQTFFTWYRKINVALTSVRNMFGIDSATEGGNGLPYGIKYLTSALDVIVPKSLFS